MNLFRAKLSALLIIFFLFSCSSGPPYKVFRQITLETPNCPVAECKLRYESESTIWEKSSRSTFTIDNRAKNLFVACYAKTDENEIVQSIVVKPGKDYISHPIDCSVLTIEEAINIEQGAKNINTLSNVSRSEQEPVNSEPIYKIQDEAAKLNLELSIPKDSSSEYSLNEIILEESLEIKESQTDKQLIDEESEEEKANKENIAQEMMNQIESLYKQGLISKESYENELEIIKNIVN